MPSLRDSEAGGSSSAASSLAPGAAGQLSYGFGGGGAHLAGGFGGAAQKGRVGSADIGFFGGRKSHHCFAQSENVKDDFDAAGDAELVEYAEEIILDRVFRKLQRGGNLAVG